MHHITDSHEWNIMKIGEHEISLPLPVILYNTEHGLSVFMYSKFERGHKNADGYYLDEKHHIKSLDNSKFFDLSITKNVFAMLISAALLILIMTSVARRYKRNPVKAPRGFQNAIEVIINFVRDEIVKPMLGRHTDKYLPYLLTIFFFIWINNLMGLLPGSANVTGNIAVTMTLALFTFIITMFSSSRHYWHHLLTAPGAPTWVKFILVPIEVISAIITKPGALMIRLFANMLAGHLIVLSFLSLIFIFAGLFGVIAGYGISIFSIAFSIFIYALELLVAVLQAYIFTNLSALFISEAIADGGHEHEVVSLEENSGAPIEGNALKHHH
jgi:F-type H+-transporting ATPase subunit a